MQEKPEQKEPKMASRKTYPLATRGQRLAAALLDDFIALLFLLPALSYYDIFSYFQTEDSVVIPVGVIVNINIYAFVLFLLVHGLLLHRYGQTVGKKVMGIAISTMDYQVPEFNRLIALRYLPFRIASVVPGLNMLPIADVLFIFRKDKRCMHDLLAKTKVISISEEAHDGDQN